MMSRSIVVHELNQDFIYNETVWLTGVSQALKLE
jgi:hypothetical protein